MVERTKQNAHKRLIFLSYWLCWAEMSDYESLIETRVTTAQMAVKTHQFEFFRNVSDSVYTAETVSKQEWIKEAHFSNTHTLPRMRTGGGVKGGVRKVPGCVFIWARGTENRKIDWKRSAYVPWRVWEFCCFASRHHAQRSLHASENVSSPTITHADVGAEIERGC